MSPVVHQLNCVEKLNNHVGNNENNKNQGKYTKQDDAANQKQQPKNNEVAAIPGFTHVIGMTKFSL